MRSRKREPPCVELVGLSGSSDSDKHAQTSSSSKCAVPASPRPHPDARPRASSLSSSPKEPSKRQRRWVSIPQTCQAMRAKTAQKHTSACMFQARPYRPFLETGHKDLQPASHTSTAHVQLALTSSVWRCRLHFAPGPWSGKFDTADGHPNHEGIVARPKRSLSPRFPVPLTISMVQALEPEIGSICPHSLERLKRRCANDLHEHCSLQALSPDHDSTA